MDTAERKLAAILAMDVVDYSAKMSQDEQATLRQLKECREIIEKVVTSNKGRIFNTAGDAFMIEFASPVAAVEAAIHIQGQIKDRNSRLPETDHLEFRMGVNMGDILIEGENLFGEGVNIAARLEGISPAGGICISEMAYNMVRGKVNADFADQGPQDLKNIDEPVRAYFVDLDSGSSLPKPENHNTRKRGGRQGFDPKWIRMAIAGVLVIIAGTVFFGDNSIINKAKDTDVGGNFNTMVLVPLTTTGTSQEQKSFALGLSQDLSSGMSKMAKGLNVVTLNQKPDDLGKVASGIGARYIINGNIRQSGDAIRVTINLIDAANMATIWTQTLDRSMSATDIFALQDEIVTGVVDELVGNGAILQKDVAKNIKSRATDDLSSYECINFVRGVFYKAMIPENFQKSMACLKETVKRDDTYALAWSNLASLTGFGYSFGYLSDKTSILEGLEAAEKATALDPNDAEAYVAKANLLFFQQDWVEMGRSLDRAVSLAPTSGQVLANSYIWVWGGDCTEEQLKDFDAKLGAYENGECQWQKAVRLMLRAAELDKANLYAGENYGLATIYNLWGKFDLALEQTARHPIPGFLWYDIHAGLATDGIGNTEQAKKHFEAIKVFLKSESIDAIYPHFVFWNIEDTYWPMSEPVFRKYGFK